jgi:hypothetical protein
VDDTPVDSTPEPVVPTTTLHVGDLDGSSVILDARDNWEATVTVTMLDADNGPVEGATVSGTWGSCTTDGAGQCSLSSGTLRKNVSTATFSVDGVSHTDYVYDAAGNADPDNDSDGTTITVGKPG